MKCLCRFAFRGNFAVTLVCWFLAAAGVALAGSPSVKTPESAPVQKTRAALIGLPLSFEANRGQTDPSVKFLSRGDGYALFLTEDSAVFKLRASGDKSAAVVRMKLVGSNADAKISGGEKLPGTANYFIGNDPNKWTNGVSTFGTVNYQHIYPGIDLVYYGTQRQLEYDFVVTPGADPKQIGLEFAGANPTLGADGSLLLTLDGAPLTFRRPVVYQTIAGKKRMIAGHYKLSGGRVHFALGNYDHTRALVIDPVLSYLTYLGGSNFDSIGFESYYGGSNATNPTQGIAIDSSENVFVTGYTQSTDFPVQNAIQAVNTTQAQTGFVAKLNPAGSQLIFSTYIGGGVLHDNTTTRPYAVAADGSGNAYVTGFTTAPQFPVTAGAYQMFCGYVNSSGDTCPNAQSAFLTKLSPSGTLVYSTFLGHLNETGVAVAVDSQGRAYVAGNSVANCTTAVPTCFPTTANAVLQGTVFNNSVNPLNQQVGSAFISVFDAAGANLLYSSLYGYSDITTTNHGATYGVGVAVDASGNFYLAGDTQNNGLPVTAGAFQHYIGNMNPALSSNSRGFVAKFNPVSSGAALAYATYLGGTDPAQGAYSDGIGGIAADAAGNAYVSGNASYNFPVTAGAYDTNPCPYTLCQNRAFLAKINPAGSALVWATFIGGTRPDLSAVDSISAPRLDANGNVYVSGAAGNNMQVPLVNPLQPANGFGGVLVTKFDPTGSTVLFSTVIYSPAANGGLFSSGVDVDTQGNVYVARRRFLELSAAFPLSALAVPPDEELVPFSDYGPDFRIAAQADNPHIKCFDLRRLTSAVTPSEEFYEFHQTQTIRADAGAWRLRINGHVKRPAEFSLRDLMNRADRRDLAVTIECSGNSGDPRIMNGLLSNAVWTGVSLSAILQECEIQPTAREVVFFGMDTEQEPKWEAGDANYPSPHGWSIFVQDAQATGNLLAFAMNGKPLAPEHGFPLRLILPGWYGMAQVKWLSLIEVTDRRYEGRHMARNYQSLRAVKSGDETLWLDTSISRNNLKSVVARVTRRRAAAGFEYRLAGAAWGGPAPIQSVEVRVDDGPWRPARMERPSAATAWSLWSFDWTDATPGPHTVVSRAINARGEIQPTREELRGRLISNREDNSQWPRAVMVER